MNKEIKEAVEKGIEDGIEDGIEKYQNKLMKYEIRSLGFPDWTFEAQIKKPAGSTSSYVIIPYVVLKTLKLKPNDVVGIKIIKADNLPHILNTLNVCEKCDVAFNSRWHEVICPQCSEKNNTLVMEEVKGGI